MDDVNLGSDEQRRVLRRGNTVLRPVAWWTSAVHDLLKYLESVDFPYSPRVLGFDDAGHEVLTFLQGDSGKDGWKKITSEEGLSKYARLLRRYHDAIADYRPAASAEWAYASGGLKPGEILCHGDFGPWNIVWQGDEPVGILDWDMVTPALPLHDVLYCLEYSAPFRDDETALRWHHFSSVPDRKRRIEIFRSAYGISPLQDITLQVASLQRKVARSMHQLAERGMEPQRTWVASGALAEAERQAQWTESHHCLFES